MTLTIMVLGMAVVTFAIKAGMFILGERMAFPPLLREGLSFVPVTVLTAIVVPMVLSPHNAGLEITWRNPQLVAAIAAILASLVFKRQLLTITVALAVFFAWQLGVLGQGRVDLESGVNFIQKYACLIPIARFRERPCRKSGRNARDAVPGASRGPISAAGAATGSRPRTGLAAEASQPIRLLR